MDHSTPTTRSVVEYAIAADGRGRRLSFAAAGFTGHQIGEALVPVVIGAVIDRAVATGDSAALGRWILILGLVFTGLLLSWRVGARLCESVVEYGAHALRMSVVRLALDPRGLATRRMPGELYSIATADAGGVSNFARTLSTKLAAVFGVLTAATALFVISIPLGLLVVLGTPPVLAIMLRLGRPLERRREADQHQAALAGALATDLLSGLRVLGGIGAQSNARTRYTTASRSSLDATMRAERYQVLYSALNVLMTRGFLAVIAGVGATLAVSGSITVGELIAVVGLAQFLSGPLIDIVYFGEGLAWARASGGRIAAFLGSPLAVDDPTGEIRAADVLEIRGETVHPGEILGVHAGPADSLELMNLLARRTASNGSVLVNGRDIDTIALDSLRRVMLVVPHDSVLFLGSIRDNVPGPRIERALVASAADEVVATLPHGLDTRVTQDGLSLSGGQRQRIALARALAADPDVLVLHDPTTAVDSVTEAAIASGIADVRFGRITVLITSNPTLLATCTKVVTL
ncbi:ABC transporter transmembrane domain-containing protein [Rhodococcoides yunnanense]|uniref:ABC transporter transmembrane domain-containing protein n=1 Tax=Rhodococcoides yunnanense TaxID=278209 RepID=UPI001FECEAEC|nr:ABC transporter ATP-binding protein [Rhodococcus yunnanensis]